VQKFVFALGKEEGTSNGAWEGVRVKFTHNRSSLLRGMAAALVLGVINITYIISSTALLFHGQLTASFQLGMAVLLLSYVVAGLVMALGSSLSGLIVAPKEVLIAILSFISTQILASGAALHHQETILATLLVSMGLTTLLTGLFFFLMGSFRMGTLIRYIPFPLIAGFFISVGVLLVEISFTIMAGTSVSLGQVFGFDPALFVLWGPGVAFGLTAFIVSRRTDHYLTIPLLTAGGIAVIFLAARLFSLSIGELQSLGILLPPVGSGSLLPRPLTAFLPNVSWPLLFEQWPRMLSLVLLSSLSILLFISITEVGVDREIDLKRDLKAAGLANMVCGLFGGVVLMHEPVDTKIAHRLGASGRSAGLFFSLFCLVLLLVGWRIVPFFPRPVMGGLILFIGLSLFWENLLTGWRRMSRPEFALVCSIAAAVAGLGFLWGLAAGLLGAILLFVVTSSRIDAVKGEFRGDIFRSRVERPLHELEFLAEQGRAIRILVLNGYLFFGTAERLLTRIRSGDGSSQGRGEYLILDFREVTSMDSSALNAFRKLHKTARGKGTVLVFTGMGPLIKRQLNAVGLDEEAGIHLFPTLDHGVNWCEEALLVAAGRKREDVAVLENLLQAIFHDPELVRLFRGNLQPVRLQENELLFEAGSKADSFYLIESGRVNAEIPGADGISTRLRGMGPGSLFGEIGLYGGALRTARVTADEPTLLYRMAYSRFLEMEKEHPHLTQPFHRYIIRVMSRRMAQDSRDPRTLL
jgi:sulfate permease, SulP family